MTNRACARPTLKSHTPIRFVSGVKAANWAEPDGNQVNAITHKSPKTPTRLRLRFQARQAPGFACYTRGGHKVPPMGRLSPSSRCDSRRTKSYNLADFDRLP